LVHQWRSEYDAVLVGAKTVMVDDPQLTVRDVSGRNPYRVILDGRLSVSPNLKIFKIENPDKTIIITSQDSKHQNIIEFLKMRINLIQIDSNNHRIDLKNILKELGKFGITSILVEGGSIIFSQIIKERTYNDLKIFLSLKFLGSGIPPVNFDSFINLKLSKIEQIDQDLLFTYLP